LITGQRVRVYPHGSPEQAAPGAVLIISANQRSIAVAFDDKPPFVIDRSGGMTLLRDEGKLVMLAMREEIGGRPWGPWVEHRGGGHFEIEAL